MGFGRPWRRRRNGRPTMLQERASGDLEDQIVRPTGPLNTTLVLHVDTRPRRRLQPLRHARHSRRLVTSPGVLLELSRRRTSAAGLTVPQRLLCLRPLGQESLRVACLSRRPSRRPFLPHLNTLTHFTSSSEQSLLLTLILEVIYL